MFPDQQAKDGLLQAPLSALFSKTPVKCKTERVPNGPGAGQPLNMKRDAIGITKQEKKKDEN